jgi:DNA-binding beta-propeller fold protein YncE
VLPYDVELDAGGRIYVADGGRHQVFRWDARIRRLVAVVGTGARGSSGDGGPARKARIDEPTCLVFDRYGNLYVSDVHNGVVRRIDRRGVISTVARLRAAAGVAVDPSGRYLVVASIEQGVSRFELASGASETLAAIGDAGLVAPHGVAYDASGNLWIADPGGHVFRIAAGTNRLEPVASVSAFRIVPQRDGSAFVVSGDPRGGRVERLGADGGLTLVAGTGTLGRHVNGIPATGAAILPSDVAAVAGGALLLAQTVPAIRRIDRAGRITTFVR